MNKRKILVTGIAGTGKSTVCKELLRMGYEAYGIENMPGMYTMYHRETHAPFPDFSNADPEDVADRD